MVRLRLRRVGRKKQPSYRIVAAEKEAPRDGRFLEIVGFYNPRTEPSTITMKEDRIFEWLSNGAQPSDAVESLFRQMGTRDRFDRFKAGESIETLLEEYAVVEENRNVTGKTRVDKKKKSKKAQAKEAAEAAAAAEEAAAEEEASAEDVVEEAAAEEEAPAEDVVEEATAEEEAPAEEETTEEAAPAEEEETEAEE
ncbi:MAG: 30S ribosomal protein S16 [Deltaproteobacteria bacterium]|jgi:small subunit ribosomal protein S16